MGFKRITWVEKWKMLMLMHSNPCQQALARLSSLFHVQLPLVSEAVMSAVRKRENEHLPEVAAQLANHADERHRSTQVVRKGLLHFEVQ